MPIKMLFLSLFYLVACVKKTPVGGDPLSETIVSLSRAWSEVSSETFLVALTEARARFPSDPSLAYWSVRQTDRSGLLHEVRDEQLSAFSQARAEAVRCMEADPLFVNRWKERGWSVAVESQDRVMVGCATAGALAWLHWLSVFGVERASLDRSELEVLIRFSEAERPDNAEVRWARLVFDYLYEEGTLDLKALDWRAEPVRLAELKLLLRARAERR